MKIKGKNNLNSNFYDSIMIRDYNEDDIVIDVKTKKKIETVKEEGSFYKRIKKLSEKEKVSEIIRYFLRNNKIKAIYNTYRTHYDGEFTVINGSRDLALQISKEKINANIIDEIIYKYRLDRDDFFNKNKIDKISIHQSKESSYYVVDDDYFCDETPYMILNLKSEDDLLLDYEEDFFIKYIIRKFNYTDKKINVKQVIYGGSIDNKTFMNQAGMYVYTNEFIIRMDVVLYFKIRNLIEKHNRKLENDKVLQLTLSDYIN